MDVDRWMESSNVSCAYVHRFMYVHRVCRPICWTEIQELSYVVLKQSFWLIWPLFIRFDKTSPTRTKLQNWLPPAGNTWHMQRFQNVAGCCRRLATRQETCNNREVRQASSSGLGARQAQSSAHGARRWHIPGNDVLWAHVKFADALPTSFGNLRALHVPCGPCLSSRGANFAISDERGPVMSKRIKIPSNLLKAS